MSDQDIIHEALAQIMGIKAPTLEKQMTIGCLPLGLKTGNPLGLNGAVVGVLTVMDMAAMTLTADRYIGSFISPEGPTKGPRHQDALPERLRAAGIGPDSPVRFHVWRSGNSCDGDIDTSMYDGCHLTFHDDKMPRNPVYGGACQRALDQVYALAEAGTPYAAFVLGKSPGNILNNLAVTQGAARFATESEIITLPSLYRRGILQSVATYGRDAVETLNALRALRSGLKPDKDWLDTASPAATIAKEALAENAKRERDKKNVREKDKGLSPLTLCDTLLVRLASECPETFAAMRSVRAALAPLGVMVDSDWESMLGAVRPDKEKDNVVEVCE